MGSPAKGQLTLRFHNTCYAPEETYSSGKTWREWYPGNEPSYCSSPVRAVLVVAIAAVWIVHSVDVVHLLVHNPVVG